MKGDITYEKNDQGEFEIIDQGGGVKVRLLKKPSEKYKKIKEAKHLEEVKQFEEAKIKRDREKKIKDKMRELAIKELEKDGQL